MAEWSNAAVLKTVEGHTSGGSNPSFSAKTLTLLLGFLYLVMKLYKYIFLLFFISLSFSSAQTDNNTEGTKIDLNNVDVKTKALPTVLLFGKQYTFRERDDFVRSLLGSKFYFKDLLISFQLEEFYTKKLYQFKHKGKVSIYIKLKKLPPRNAYNSFSPTHMNANLYRDKLINSIKSITIDSIQEGIIKRKTLLSEKNELNNKLSDTEVSLDKYKEFYDNLMLDESLDIYLKRLSDRKFKQLKGLEKVSTLQKNYRSLKRRISRIDRDIDAIALLVISID